MAKVIAPFIIKGTLDDINFYQTTADGNLARTKGKTGITKKQFEENPIFTRIKQHGAEFGNCAKKSKVFRLLAKPFFDQAKEGSFAGRVNKLLFEILEEDTLNPKGNRTLNEGMKSPFLNEIILGFEGNKSRTLKKVLQTTYYHSHEDNAIKIIDFAPLNHLDWPEDATHVHLAMATANWDFENDTFDTCYSEVIKIAKEDEIQNINLSTEKPKGNKLQLTYLYIGFAKQERRKYKPFHRRSNTVSIVACNYPSPISP